MANERRRSNRYKLSQLVELQFGRETFIPAVGADISSLGIGCISADPVDLYSRMFFMLQLNPEAQEPEIRGEAIVVRCNPLEDGNYDLGLEFSEMTSSMVQKVENFLA